MNDFAISSSPLIEVENLRIGFGDAAPVVKGVSFTLKRGECLAIVGESGSGKSVTSRTLTGLNGSSARIAADKLVFNGIDIQSITERQWRDIRGKQIGVITQDALGSLDPLIPIGHEIAESLRLHTRLNREQRDARVVELLAAVGVPEPALRARLYPHQLSGGLRQRALIASAIACSPQLLIADEPTTALDATVQAKVIDLLQILRTRETSMLVISHDLAVVARLADRVAVMKHGHIVEQGTADQILNDPQHPYTKSLLWAATSVRSKGKLVAGPTLRTITDTNSSRSLYRRNQYSYPVIESRELSKSFTGPDARKRTAVSNISFSLKSGETLGIVGESGSGKTTLTRLILGLERPDGGGFLIRGKEWTGLTDKQKRETRRNIQVVFQDPLASFDPRYTTERVIGEPLDVLSNLRGKQKRARIIELLELVRLDESYLSRRPIELSGGERQRVAIARALASNPDVLVCDEPVSALDVSVQAQVLDLLDDLKTRLSLSCVFISHDLGVIYHVSDRVLVMKDGVAVEQGAVADIFDRPQHAYTKSLLNAIPHFEPREKQKLAPAVHAA